MISLIFSQDGAKDVWALVLFFFFPPQSARVVTDDTYLHVQDFGGGGVAHGGVLPQGMQGR